MQLLLNIALSTTRYLPIALALWLVLRSARFFDAGMGGLVAVGAYATWALHARAGIGLPGAIVLGAMVAAGLAACIDRSVLAALRSRGASSLGFLAASLGVYVLLENGLLLLFGADTRAVCGGTAEQLVAVGAGRMSVRQLLTGGGTVGATVTGAMVLYGSRIGVAMRGVMTDPELALISGVDCSRARSIAYCVAGGLAGFGGSVLALDFDLRPTMGLQPLLAAATAVVLGGSGRMLGAVVGTVAVAGMQQLIGYWLGASWQDVITSGLLLALLMAKARR